MYDLNDVEPQRSGELIPDGTFTKVEEILQTGKRMTGVKLTSGEIIEAGDHYLWVRVFVPDGEWPRIIELRADALTSMIARRASA